MSLGYVRYVPVILADIPAHTMFIDLYLYMQQTTTPMQLQITPCTAQVAGHPRMQSWPAQMRALSATILAAICINMPTSW